MTNSYFIVIENVLFLLITVVLLLFNAIFSTNKLLSPCFVIVVAFAAPTITALYNIATGNRCTAKRGCEISNCGDK